MEELYLVYYNRNGISDGHAIYNDVKKAEEYFKLLINKSVTEEDMEEHLNNGYYEDNGLEIIICNPRNLLDKIQ